MSYVPDPAAVEIAAQAGFVRAADWIHGGRHYANSCAIGNCEQRAHVMCRELAALMVVALVESGQLAEPRTLEPAENMALMVALAQVDRGESPPPNTAYVVVHALARLAGREGTT